MRKSGERERGEERDCIRVSREEWLEIEVMNKNQGEVVARRGKEDEIHEYARVTKNREKGEKKYFFFVKSYVNQWITQRFTVDTVDGK